jgi:hypothetical protein
VKNNLCFEIRLLEATGVPIPDEKEVPRQNFLCREAGLILFDRVKNKFEGNACYLKAGWRPEYEDRWIFEGQL